VREIGADVDEPGVHAVSLFLSARSGVAHYANIGSAPARFCVANSPSVNRTPVKLATLVFPR